MKGALKLESIPIHSAVVSVQSVMITQSNMRPPLSTALYEPPSPPVAQNTQTGHA